MSATPEYIQKIEEAIIDRLTRARDSGNPEGWSSFQTLCAFIQDDNYDTRWASNELIFTVLTHMERDGRLQYRRTTHNQRFWRLNTKADEQWLSVVRDRLLSLGFGPEDFEIGVEYTRVKTTAIVGKPEDAP